MREKFFKILEKQSKEIRQKDEKQFLFSEGAVKKRAERFSDYLDTPEILEFLIEYAENSPTQENWIVKKKKKISQFIMSKYNFKKSTVYYDMTLIKRCCANAHLKRAMIKYLYDIKNEKFSEEERIKKENSEIACKRFVNRVFRMKQKKIRLKKMYSATYVSPFRF